MKINGHKFEIRNLRCCTGHEGPGGPKAWSGNLYMDGKQVAAVSDDSWGGGYMVHWKEPKQGKSVGALLEEHAKTLGEFCHIDSVLARMADEAETEATYRRRCKKSTVFLLKGDAPGTMRVLSAVYTAQVKADLQRRHGDKLLKIINERFGGLQVAPAAEDDEKARWRRLIRSGKTLYRVKTGDAAGTITVMYCAAPFTQDLKARIERQFGDRLVEILNETM